MFLSLFIGLAIANTSIQQFVSDPNLRVASDGNGHRRFMVTNIASYNTSDNNSNVEAKDGSSHYIFSKNLKKEALYKKQKGPDGSFTTARYRIQDGVVTSITECKIKKEKGLVFTSEVQECLYMDDTYCNNLNETEITRIQNDINPNSKEPVQLENIFRAGSKTKGDNYNERYVGHAADAISGLQEMFDMEGRSVIRRGVQPNEVAATISHVRRICEYLNGNNSGIPGADPSRDTGSARQ